MPSDTERHALGAASRSVVRRDPALRLLPVMLDDASLTDWLAERVDPRLGERLERAERVYLRYKPGTSLLATVRLHTGDGDPRTVLVGHRAAAQTPKLAKAHRRSRLGTLLLCDERDGVIVATPAGDHRLPALRRLHDPARRARLVESVLGKGVLDPRGGLRLTTLSYKPERRWVGCVTDAAGREALLRAYAPADLPGHLAQLRHLGDHDLPLPRLLGKHPRLGLAGLAWLPGERLTLPATDALDSVGTTLARLHARRPELGKPPAVHHAHAGLRRTADHVADLLPEQAARADRLAVRLSYLEGPRPDALVHGDLSCDQVVVGPDGTARLIDLDRARPGHAAEDLGSLLATAYLDGLDGPAAGAVVERVRAGYAAHRTPPHADDVDAGAAAALLARCTDGFKQGLPDWDGWLVRALDGAEALLDGRGLPC